MRPVISWTALLVVAPCSAALLSPQHHGMLVQQHILSPAPHRAAAAVLCAAVVSDDEAISITKQWINNVVIRLGLCPYAAKPFVADQIRYVVSTATDDESFIADFFVESALLLDVDEEELSTTFLIAPQYVEEGVEGFYWLYEWLVDTLEGAPAAIDEGTLDESTLQGLVGDRIQPAFFHPEWSFSELPPASPTHFEKRAPFAVINLLRRAQLDAVVAKGLENGVIVNKQIAEHNVAALEQEGYASLEAIFAQLRPTVARK